jgi:hypothetical protein
MGGGGTGGRGQQTHPLHSQRSGWTTEWVGGQENTHTNPDPSKPGRALPVHACAHPCHSPPRAPSSRSTAAPSLHTAAVSPGQAGARVGIAPARAGHRARRPGTSTARAASPPALVTAEETKPSTSLRVRVATVSTTALGHRGGMNRCVGRRGGGERGRGEHKAVQKPHMPGRCRTQQRTVCSQKERTTRRRLACPPPSHPFHARTHEHTPLHTTHTHPSSTDRVPAPGLGTWAASAAITAHTPPAASRGPGIPSPPPSTTPAAVMAQQAPHTKPHRESRACRGRAMPGWASQPGPPLPLASRPWAHWAYTEQATDRALAQAGRRDGWRRARRRSGSDRRRWVVKQVSSRDWAARAEGEEPPPWDTADRQGPRYQCTEPTLACTWRGGRVPGSSQGGHAKGAFQRKSEVWHTHKIVYQPHHTLKQSLPLTPNPPLPRRSQRKATPTHTQSSNVRQRAHSHTTPNGGSMRGAGEESGHTAWPYLH